MATISQLPTLIELTDSLFLLEHADRGGAPAGISTNGYALRVPTGLLLVDCNVRAQLPSLLSLARMGDAPIGLLLTHRHLAGTGDGIAHIAQEFDIPVFLHPLDAMHPQARWAGVAYEDPRASATLDAAGCEVIPFPGHTPGHVMLYLAAEGGVLLSGDAAMGATRSQDARGVAQLVRPPADFNVDDDLLRHGWIGFQRPVATFAPYHGRPYPGRAGDMHRIMQPLRRAQPTGTLLD